MDVTGVEDGWNTPAFLDAASTSVSPRPVHPERGRPVQRRRLVQCSQLPASRPVASSAPPRLRASPWPGALCGLLRHGSPLGTLPPTFLAAMDRSWSREARSAIGMVSARSNSLGCPPVASRQAKLFKDTGYSRLNTRRDRTIYLSRCSARWHCHTKLKAARPPGCARATTPWRMRCEPELRMRNRLSCEDRWLYSSRSAFLCSRAATRPLGGERRRTAGLPAQPA